MSLTLDYLQIAFFILGILHLVFGIVIFFSNSFYGWLEKRLWKEEKGKTFFVGMLSKKSQYQIGKYLTPIESILVGVILLAFVFLTFK